MMSPRERAAFVRGYRLALRKARREFQQMSQHWDDELCRVDDEMRVAREQMAQSIDEEIDGVRAEMQAARAEFLRLKAVEQGIAAERDLDAWLN